MLCGSYTSGWYVHNEWVKLCKSISDCPGVESNSIALDFKKELKLVKVYAGKWNKGGYLELDGRDKCTEEKQRK